MNKQPRATFSLKLYQGMLLANALLWLSALLFQKPITYSPSAQIFSIASRKEMESSYTVFGQELVVSIVLSRIVKECSATAYSDRIDIHGCNQIARFKWKLAQL